MKLIKRLITLVIAATIFLLTARLFDYILVDDTKSYTRIMMHQLYTSDENIDIVFVGSSHVYRSIDPAITDEEMGKHTFNLGTSAQDLDGSLALIKEANKKNDISKVYLELYYGVAGQGKYRDREDLTKTYLISDYMKPSLNKILYLTNASKNEHWINSFFPARRYTQKLMKINEVVDLIKKKQTDDYRNYRYIRKEKFKEWYVDRGFVASEKIYDPKSSEDSTVSEIPMDTFLNRESDWNKYLCKIVNYCKKNDIEITFFISPIYGKRFETIVNYQQYHDFVDSFAREMDVEFVDFNLIKEEYFDICDPCMFADKGHLNQKGAERFSRVFGETFNGETDIENAFYDSIDDKIVKSMR
ncbi:MAG: hypothetical protein K6A74_11060 [Lachnospiraceae bacterium]|nr:hypothetical protein [Lachnospiraceae bacterium]